MAEERDTDTNTSEQDAAVEGRSPHPADNVTPESNPETEREALTEAEEKLDRLSTH